MPLGGWEMGDDTCRCLWNPLSHTSRSHAPRLVLGVGCHHPALPAGTPSCCEAVSVPRKLLRSNQWLFSGIFHILDQEKTCALLLEKDDSSVPPMTHGTVLVSHWLCPGGRPAAGRGSRFCKERLMLMILWRLEGVDGRFQKHHSQF